MTASAALAEKYQNMPVPITKILLIFLLVINVVTFFVYGVDKAASKRGQSQKYFGSAERKQFRTKSNWKAKRSVWRIPEMTLLLLAVIGGSAGAWAGMKVWHHKTAHKKFKYGIPLIIIIQAAIVLWVFFSQMNNLQYE